MNKKRSRLFLSITALMFCIGIMCFGVYAATSVSYTLSGNITYNVENAYVDITTNVYSSSEILDYESGANIATQFMSKNSSEISTVASQNELTKVGTYTQTSLGESYQSDLATSLDEITYSQQDGYAYFLVVNIENLSSSELVHVMMQDEQTLPQNSWTFNTGYILGFDSSADDKNIIIAFGLENPATNVDTSFSFGIDIALGEVEPTSDKYTADDYNTISLNEEAKGVVVLEYYEDAKYIDYFVNDNVTYIVAPFGGEYITEDSASDGRLTSVMGVGGNIRLDYWIYSPKFVYYDIQGLEDEYSVVDGSLYSSDLLTFISCPRGKTKVSVLDGVENIDAGAFYSFHLHTVIIPESVSNIGKAFLIVKLAEIYNLSSVNLQDDYYFNSDEYVNIYDNLSTPSSIVEIDDYYFLKNQNDGKYYLFDYLGDDSSLELPIVEEGVDHVVTECSIWNYGAINHYNFIESITIPEGYNTIDNYSFSELANLKSVVLPSTISSLGDAFGGCNAIESVTIYAVVPPTIGDYSFLYSSQANVYVPSESLEAYKSAKKWSEYANRIYAIA